MNSSRISVITVVKNDACYLEETILNVIEKKTSAEIDHLIIDGGSTDGTVDIIKKYSDNISYWISEADDGIYDAMNKGWAAAADNSFIMFLGAGDRIISLPRDMGCYLQNDVVYGNVRMGEKMIFNSRSDFHLNLYNSLHHQALLVNKGLHTIPPFNVNYRLYADFDLNQRLKKKGVHFVYSSEFVGYARPGGVSDRNCFAESLSVISANFGFLWVALAFSGFYAIKVLPILKKLRPFVKHETECL